MQSYLGEQNPNTLDNTVHTYHLYQNGTANFNVGNSALTQQFQPQYFRQLLQATTDSASRQNSQHHSNNANGSTDLSFMITLSQDQAKVFLSRAKRMHKASKDCQNLTQDIVQSVNQTFANIKQQNVMRLFDDVQANNTETESTERLRSRSLTATAKAGVDLSAFAPAAVDAARPRAAERRIPWEQLHVSTQYRRLQTATDAFRISFIPYLLAVLGAVDANGRDMHINDIFAILLRYGILTANKNHRLADGLSLPACLPEEVCADDGPVCDPVPRHTQDSARLDRHHEA